MKRAGPKGESRPNLLILMTDQQRAPRHWPAGWAERHLPSFRRLAQHGLTFTNAFTSASECSPSRAAFLTSKYPQENGVTTTPGDLAPSLNNLAKVMGQAGYRVVYKGKWHLTAAAKDAGSADALAVYGAADWTPPEAGHTLQLDASLGGGVADNDGRIVRGLDGRPGQTPGHGQSVLEFLHEHDPAGPPFCLFVSLVNPHDIHIIHEESFAGAGYRREEFAGLGIEPPANFLDPLTTKPSVQAELRRRWPAVAGDSIWDYVNFYAYLQIVVDAHIGAILDALEDRGLREHTLIVRLSDHGEMALSHGLCQKMYNAYEEAMHVPLIFSHPGWFPKPATTDALATLVDLLPTLADLAGVRGLRSAGFRGRSLRPILENPRKSVQDSVLFTFDDPFYPDMPGPGHIRCLRTSEWKYAVYFDDAGWSFQYELYNLAKDPGELVNLAYDAPVSSRWRKMHQELTRLMTRLKAKPAGFDWSAARPRRWK